MKTVIDYYSRFGHTRRLAEAMAERLAPEGTARTMPTEQVSAAELQGADLVAMGAPTHCMRLPEEVRPLLEALPRKCLAGAAVEAFDTSYRMNRFLARFTATKALDRKLGGKRMAPPETFFMAGREEPLEEGEMEQGCAWAGMLAAAVRALKEGQPHGKWCRFAQIRQMGGSPHRHGCGVRAAAPRSLGAARARPRPAARWKRPTRWWQRVQWRGCCKAHWRRFGYATGWP